MPLLEKQITKGHKRPGERRGPARVKFSPQLWRTWLAAHNERLELKRLPPIEGAKP